MNDKEKLRNQVTESAANTVYTYAAHWNIVNRLKDQYKKIKLSQIVLTAISTTGILTSLISGVFCLSWIGGGASAIALALNLYMLNFDVADEIKKHTDAANELWIVREGYKSLLVDFDALKEDEIRRKRDRLIETVAQVNKEYPGTDEKAFKKAQEEIGKYSFSIGEAEALLNGGGKEKHDGE